MREIVQLTVCLNVHQFPFYERNINDNGTKLGRLSNQYHPNNRRNQNFKTKRMFFTCLFYLFLICYKYKMMQTSNLYMYGLKFLISHKSVIMHEHDCF